MELEIKDYIRNIKDFPKPGIIFRDITTILKDPVALNFTLHKLIEFTDHLKIDKVVAIEARGFIFGSLLAQKLNAGFIPIRKPGKLPAEKVSQTYSLEYGEDSIEIHKDAITKGENVLLHDDLLATGGTAKAACQLIEKLGGNVIQASFIIELSYLNGRKKLSGYDVKTILNYDSE